jgi:ligand-binding SRPBCC domain-containing protein
LKLKTFWLRTELWLPRGRDEIFKFFADPRNLDRLTPSWLQFRILSPTDITMSKGTLLDYRLRIRGVPIRWQSEISSWDPPDRFVDRQTKGPYSLWLHEHTFAAHDGGTLVGDNVEYAVPGGTIVQKLLVAPDIARIFNYRHRVLQELFNPAQITPRQRTGT